MYVYNHEILLKKYNIILSFDIIINIRRHKSDFKHFCFINFFNFGDAEH